jgi:hypothetical protein
MLYPSLSQITSFSSAGNAICDRGYYIHHFAGYAYGMFCVRCVNKQGTSMKLVPYFRNNTGGTRKTRKKLHFFQYLPGLLNV